MKRKLILTLTFVVLVGLIGGFSYFQFVIKPEMIKGFIAAAKQPPATISAEAAKRESWIARLPAIGTFTAVQGIDVAPQVDGIISALHFDSGQDVEQGQLLLELDDQVDQADRKSALAQLKNAELDLARQQSLLKLGNTPKSNYDRALAARDTATADVERVNAIIARKKIVAPFSGRLGIRKVDVGQYLSPGTPIVTLQQLDPIYVDFPIPEKNLTDLAIGQKVEVAVDAIAGKVFDGAVVSIDARINQNTRNVLVRAKLENPGKTLLPGMFANVNLLVGAPQDVVTVPRTAVSYSLYGDSVYIVKPPAKEGDPQTVERRFVKVGPSEGPRVEVVEGVEAGEEVVTSGQVKLHPNASVVVDNSAAPKPQAERPKE